MALSAQQKEMVFQAFISIVKDADSLFNFFVPNTKPQMIAIIESKLDEKKLSLQNALAVLDANKIAEEARINAEILVIDDLKTQI